MKLNSFHGIIFVPQSHDFTLGGPGADFKAGRQGFRPHQQGMIPPGGERIGQPRKYRFAVVLYGRYFSVHDAFGANDFSAERIPDGLMSQANA